MLEELPAPGTPGPALGIPGPVPVPVPRDRSRGPWDRSRNRREVRFRATDQRIRIPPIVNPPILDPGTPGLVGPVNPGTGPEVPGTGPGVFGIGPGVLGSKTGGLKMGGGPGGPVPLNTRKFIVFGKMEGSKMYSTF